MIHAPFRPIFLTAGLIIVSAIALASRLYSPLWSLAYLLILPVLVLGLRDILQKKQAIRHNYPLLGRLRYFFENIRPEIQQYFVEGDIDGRPFDREKRSNIYQRAKKQLNTRPFGTKLNVYNEGYEWINHSMTPTDMHEQDAPRIMVGEGRCDKPYSASLFNISAMSYGSLSTNAVLALNKGAKLGGFYHNSGEGGISPYHTRHGGDLVWQVGTGYFGCRTSDGNFNPELFAERSTQDTVKMIELKLSQGAKPGHGGILPKEKITPEIAEIRAVSGKEDVLSPPFHKAFNTPIELLELITEMRKLSGGKPVGFKLCVGNDYEFFAICKAMLETGLSPDFITIDGSEGGTGAAPFEFADSIGMPLTDGLVFVQNALTGLGLRDKVRVVAAGKITTGFQIIRSIALGADYCNSGRGMMFALGCIQALQCHANTCPTGVATQDPYLVQGLDPEHKAVRVYQYHQETIKHMMEIIGAAGLHHTSELTPWHIFRRIDQQNVRRLSEIYTYLQPNAILNGDPSVSDALKTAFDIADPHSFKPRKQFTNA